MRPRYAGLSLYPDDQICPGSKAAGCMNACLKSAGLGFYTNVTKGRQNKADWFKSDPNAFLDQLKKELKLFSKLCLKQGFKPVVRLNVISDVDWTRYGIPQAFPEIQFIDYTKIPIRLRPGYLPPNYKLIFSYSGAESFTKLVSQAWKTTAPVAVVFSGKEIPKTFFGRQVIDGDQSDLLNAFADGQIVGLRAKGKAKKEKNGFVVDPNLILIASAA